jgi:hypothetical protein
MIKQLQKGNQVFCTTRNYREATQLAKLKKLKLVIIGKHGGQNKLDKLNASINRMTLLTRSIQRFNPDLAISFCSPEAARISFGLGIRHVAFCDSPHAEAVMRLSIPLIQKLLIPWIIPKKEFTKYGIAAKNIIPYRAIDASIIVKNTSYKKTQQTRKQKNILIRIEEEQAAYSQKKHTQVLRIIKGIAVKFQNENVLVLPRYRSQIKALRRTLGARVKVLDKVVIGKTLLENTDVFVGSGGTMTAEAALVGIPTISYNAIPNLIQDFLVRKKLIIRESNPKKIVLLINKLLYSDNKNLQKNAKITLSSMEDPFKKLNRVIKMR